MKDPGTGSSGDPPTLPVSGPLRCGHPSVAVSSVPPPSGPGPPCTLPVRGGSSEFFTPGPSRPMPVLTQTLRLDGLREPPFGVRQCYNGPGVLLQGTHHRPPPTNTPFRRPDPGDRRTPVAPRVFFFSSPKILRLKRNRASLVCRNCSFEP